MGRTTGITTPEFTDRLQAVIEVFDALARHRPAAVEALRSVSDASGVVAWGGSYNLNIPSIEEFAQRQIEFWGRRPELKKMGTVDYEGGPVIPLVPWTMVELPYIVLHSPPPPSDELIALKASPEWAPFHYETKREFRARTETMFSRLRKLEPAFVERGDPQTFKNYAEWFVRNQVREKEPVDAIIGPLKLHRSRVYKGINIVRVAIGVAPKSSSEWKSA